MALEDRLALVTGASRGIGRGVCHSLAAAGYAVAINYRSRRELAEETKRECLERGAPWAEVFAADVGCLEDQQRLLDELRNGPGRIDLLVNNAGITSPVRGEMLEVTPQAWDLVLATNLKGPFFLSQQVAKWMISLRGAGIIQAPAIVNISSISAYIASTARAEYCISKAGLSMLTQLLAHRLATEGILVYEVRPGIIRTDMTSAATDKYDRLIAEGLTPIRRWGMPEDVGQAVVALVSGQFAFSTGEVVNVDGGFHSRHL